MNWEALGSVGGAVGAVGVITTLAYLSLQIRQSNANSRADGVHGICRDYRDLGALVMQSENLGVFMKGLTSYWTLPAEERFKFDVLLTAYVNLVETNIYHAEAGRLDEVLTMQSRYLGPRVFAYPGFQEWWQQNRGAGFADATSAWVDEWITRNSDVNPFWTTTSA